MTPCLITTTIPYVNARPHLGFALELVQADVLARWQRLRGVDTFLLTGTDENSLKNVRAARAEGIPVRALCDRNAAVFRDLLAALRISADGFVRTSCEAHHRAAERLFTDCRPDDRFEGAYRGLYCVDCEDFYLDRDLPDGNCPVHGRPVEKVDERNWFFRLSGYGKALEDLIASGRLRITPESRRNEALAFVRAGLRDFSISRSRQRAGDWGVPMPGDAGQVLYVWFDALANYLTGVGYPGDPEGFAGRWAESGHIIHVLGKDVLKFHAVCWPAMLLSAGLTVPHRLHVHGHLTVDGRKIGKSLGNAVDPFAIVETLGADALRYYLLRAVPSDEDSDFSRARLVQLYNADLANGLGNLVARLETLAERSAARLGPTDSRTAQDLTVRLEAAVDACRFHVALADLWTVVTDLNREVEAARPWEALRAGRLEAVRPAVRNWIARLRAFARALGPFLPDTAAEIERRLAGPAARRGAPLFPRQQGCPFP